MGLERGLAGTVVNSLALKEGDLYVGGDLAGGPKVLLRATNGYETWIPREKLSGALVVQI